MKKWFLALVIIAVVVVAAVFVTHRGKTVAPPIVYKGSLVSLGDSVAAGVGLKDDSDSSACDRTNQAYPHVLAAQEKLRLDNVACSGATIAQGIDGKQDVNKALVTPQLQQLFSQAQKPSLVTMTIGANDAHWREAITSCYTGICGDSQDTAAVDSALAVLKTNLGRVFNEYNQHYGNDAPPLLITDYYQVFPASKADGCSSLTGISDDELSWLRAQREKINQTISQAASGQPHVSLVSVNFNGHELCTDDTWVQGLTSPDPYHPTAAGQAAIARALAQAYAVETK